MNVSIIIATYGDQEWADLAQERAFPTAASQEPGEVLIGHDPDGTIASIRNYLASQAICNWLCFLDADDELAPGYLGAMERAFEQQGDGPWLLTPAVQKIMRGRRAGRPNFYPEVPLHQANWLVVGTLIQRDIFMRAEGFSDYPHGFEDWSLWYKAHRLGAKVVRVRSAVYVQHVNPQSKHRLGWKNRRWQVETHQRVEAELAAWTP